MEDLEYRAYWWLPKVAQTQNDRLRRPSDLDEQVTGTLAFSPTKGISLSLIGTLVDVERKISKRAISDNGRRWYPLVLGWTSNGRCISIHKCYPTVLKGRYPGFITQDYVGLKTFISRTYWVDPEVTKFRKLKVQYSYLLDWIGFTNTVSSSGKGNTITYKHKYPNELSGATT
jgi:ApeA N-terminal domain 1